jgi:hypothetical protein
MKKIFLFFFLAHLFTFCSGPKEKVQEKKAEIAPGKIPYVLQKQDLFTFDSIKAAAGRANQDQKAESRKFFLQGLDLLSNKQNALASIEFFRESIYYYPDEKNYFYLTQALINVRNLAQADSANTIVSMMGFEPYYEVTYNYALIEALKMDTNACIGSLNECIMNGFLAYQSMILAVFKDDEKLQKLVFRAFLKSFPDLQLPFEMGADSARSFSFDKYINYDFATFIPGMEEGRFSRDVTNEYMAIGKIKLENAFAVVYKSFLAIADTLNPVKTFICTYDTSGKMIGNEMIACYCSPTNAKACSITPDFVVHMSDYKINWAQDPLEKGFAKNTVVSTEEQSKSELKLSRSGGIQRDEIAGNANTKVKSGI